jgi:predicted MPP superfamily phosphohydrolase
VIAAHATPFAVGDRVLLWGVPGVIECIARSLATDQPIITVAHGPRIKLRVNATEVVPAP